MENFILKAAIMLPPALFAITCHEVSHGFVAHKLGDDTAYNMGRLSLNPLKHLDIIGTLMIYLVGIGWAKPVPVNSGNLRNPKRDMIWVAAAGPATNLFLAVVSALLLRSIGVYLERKTGPGTADLFVGPLALMLSFSVHINLLLTIFNLIPVPPLDGGRVVVGLLPDRLANVYLRLEPYGLIIIILFAVSPLFHYFISPIMGVGMRVLTGPQTGLVYEFANILQNK